MFKFSLTVVVDYGRISLAMNFVCGQELLKIKDARSVI